MSGKQKILVVEDDRDMVLGLTFNLEARGYQVVTAYDGRDGLQKAVNEFPDLVLLDVMLPGPDGFEVCRQLKKKKPQLPIVMLTARGQEDEVVLGLESGADDYVTKPFSVAELVARIAAVLRRASSRDRVLESYRLGDIRLDFKKYRAEKAGEALDLSPKEFEILKYFILHPDRPVTRDELLNRVWGYDCDSTTRTVDTHIAKLRHKIEDDPQNPAHILTIHGIGYRFVG